MSPCHCPCLCLCRVHSACPCLTFSTLSCAGAAFRLCPAPAPFRLLSCWSYNCSKKPIPLPHLTRTFNSTGRRSRVSIWSRRSCRPRHARRLQCSARGIFCRSCSSGARCVAGPSFSLVRRGLFWLAGICAFRCLLAICFSRQAGVLVMEGRISFDGPCCFRLTAKCAFDQRFHLAAQNLFAAAQILRLWKEEKAQKGDAQDAGTGLN